MKTKLTMGFVMMTAATLGYSQAIKPEIKPVEIKPETKVEITSEVKVDSQVRSNVLNLDSKGGGGGDALSSRINAMARYIGEDGAGAKSDLLKITQGLSIFPSDTEVGRKISAMIQHGLAEDIKASPYQLRDYCADENGVERSASTKKIDLITYPNQGHPAICINVRKLAFEGASERAIQGLLFHEHARHFGFEDTNSYGLHPIGFYVEKQGYWLHLKSYSTKYFPTTYLFEGVVARKGTLEEVLRPGSAPHGDHEIDLITNDVNNLRVKIKGIEGKCKISVTADAEYGGAYKKLGRALVGSEFDFSIGYQSINTREVGSKGKLTFSSDRGKDCFVTFSVVNSKGEAQVTTKTPLHKGPVEFEAIDVNRPLK